MSTPVALDVAVLTAFLNARLDEARAAAKAAIGKPHPSPIGAGPGVWVTGDPRFPGRDLEIRGDDMIIYDEGGHSLAHAVHIARHDPARVLRGVAAMRELTAVALENAAMIDGEWGDGHEAAEIAGGKCADHGARAAMRVLGPLAAIWSDHADYPQEVSP